MTTTASTAVFGPVVCAQQRNGTWLGSCLDCDDVPLLFSAADFTAAETSANRHWLFMHPDFAGWG